MDKTIDNCRKLLDTLDIKSCLIDKTIVISNLMSVTFGIGLIDSCIVIGRALDNPTERLERLNWYGFCFDDSHKLKIQEYLFCGCINEAQLLILNRVEHWLKR